MAAYYAPYTEAHDHPPATVYPTPGLQLLASLVPLIGLSVLSFCFAKRMDYWGDLWSWRTLKEIPWSKFCVSLIFTFSWAFVFSTAVLQFGAGLSSHTIVCTLADFSCIILYACSKLFIYLFLIEKVYVVWAPYGTPRLKTPIFRVCAILIVPLAVVVCLCILGRFAEIRTSDRVCVIGLATASVAGFLTYDLFMTIVLTVLFVYPLWSCQTSKPIRRIASRTLIASLAALSTSAINVAILTSMHGRQLGWLCLSSCGTDVTLNAIVVWWVTRPQLSSKFVDTTPSLPPISCTATSASSTTHSANHQISVHLSTSQHRTPAQPRARTVSLKRQPSQITSSKMTLGEGPLPEEAEPSSTHVVDDKASGLLDAIFEAWQAQGGEEGSSLQVTIMTEEPPEDEEQDIGIPESGGPSQRAKPHR